MDNCLVKQALWFQEMLRRALNQLQTRTWERSCLCTVRTVIWQCRAAATSFQETTAHTCWSLTTRTHCGGIRLCTTECTTVPEESSAYLKQRLQWYYFSSYVLNYCIILAIVDLCFLFYPSPIIDQKLLYICMYIDTKCFFLSESWGSWYVQCVSCGFKMLCARWYISYKRSIYVL